MPLKYTSERLIDSGDRIGNAKQNGLVQPEAACMVAPGFAGQLNLMELWYPIKRKGALTYMGKECKDGVGITAALFIHYVP